MFSGCEMNKTVAILAALFLVISGTGGFFYWQQSQDLEEALGEIDSLSGQAALLQSDISSLNGELSDIGGSINSYLNSVSVLKERIAGIGTNNYNAPFVISLVKPSIVRIEVSTRAPGTGIILTNNGYVMTNSHVIEGSTSIQIVLSGGQSHSATVVADDPDIDLAILQIESDRDNFPVAMLGNYEDITVGEEVLALGFPYFNDLSGDLSATLGIVSAIRFIESYGYEYIQTDAEISLGFGGGPLVNMQGEVIGINTWGYTDGEGVTFAITVNDMKDLIDRTIGTTA